MNAPTPDYGEPWKVGRIDRPMEDRHGHDPLMLHSTASRAVFCVNACAGMADPAAEIQAMRATLEAFWEALPERLRQERELNESTKAIRDADLALQKCLNYLIVQPIFTRNNSDIERESETMESVHLALAKLRPFITP